jgi:hypothetical protein
LESQGPNRSACACRASECCIAPSIVINPAKARPSKAADGGELPANSYLSGGAGPAAKDGEWIIIEGRRKGGIQ